MSKTSYSSSPFEKDTPGKRPPLIYSNYHQERKPLHCFYALMSNHSNNMTKLLALL